MNSKKYEWNNWNEINWQIVEIAVFKLQKRIYKASQRGDTKSVHKLQRLLTKSYFCRLWATRRVTQDNQGKKTAGVDGVKKLTPKQRLELSYNLRLNGKSKPTRRVWIPKPNGEQRPLGIPTMEERAKQALAKLALEPQWEYHFEDNSYGFRPCMSGHDAIQAIFIAIRSQPKYVLDADIAKCFDKIDHNKLLSKLQTYPELKRQIKAWLKSGVIDKSWSSTIIRHRKVKSGRSYFDGESLYWATRLGEHPEMPKTKATLLKRQKGKCNHCGLYFKEGDVLEVDHIIPKSKGGKDEYKNFQLLHRHCHDNKTTTDGSLANIPIDEIPSDQLQLIAENLFNDRIKEGDGRLTAWEFQVLRKVGLLNCTHDKGSAREKPYEVKVSRTVLKTSGSGDTSA